MYISHDALLPPPFGRGVAWGVQPVGVKETATARHHQNIEFSSSRSERSHLSGPWHPG